jgi:hypothetical protein
VSNALSSPLIVLVASLFVFWLASWLGARIHRRWQNFADENREDFMFVVGGILTLLAMLLGFTFSMAVSRYDLRKNCEEQEANALGTEYLRISELPTVDVSTIQDLLKNYLEQRILFYVTDNGPKLRQVENRTAALQAQLWSATASSVGNVSTPRTMLILSGMNDVFNSQGYTSAAWRNHIPPSALLLVIALSILCNFLVGYMAHRRRAFLLLVLPLALAISLFMIADIDSPRGGYIRVRPQNLQSLAESLGTH